MTISINAKEGDQKDGTINDLAAGGTSPAETAFRSVENPFRKWNPILRANQILKVAHDRAIHATPAGIIPTISPVLRAKRKETRRVEVYWKTIVKYLERIIKEFPNLDSDLLHPFYRENVHILMGVDEVRQVLGSVSGSIRVVTNIKRDAIRQLWKAKSTVDVKKIGKTAFGRMASVVNQLDERLMRLEELRRQLRRLPSVIQGGFTVCVSGYPNVGKSSFVRSLTRAKPEIGSYPFTTKEVTIGHLQVPLKLFDSKFGQVDATIPCQIVDTPGILDRPISERNQIEQRAIVAIKHLANIIIYLVDPSLGLEPETISPQIKLYQEIKTIFPDIRMGWAISKMDTLVHQGMTLERLKTGVLTTEEEAVLKGHPKIKRLIELMDEEPLGFIKTDESRSVNAFFERMLPRFKDHIFKSVMSSSTTARLASPRNDDYHHAKDAGY